MKTHLSLSTALASPFLVCPTSPFQQPFPVWQATLPPPCEQRLLSFQHPPHCPLTYPWLSPTRPDPFPFEENAQNNWVARKCPKRYRSLLPQNHGQHRAFNNNSASVQHHQSHHHHVLSCCIGLISWMEIPARTSTSHPFQRWFLTRRTTLPRLPSPSFPSCQW